jgi:hypothetical protein
MPVFDFGGWPQVHAAMPGLRILVTMTHPGNLDHRDELHAALVVELYDMVKDDPNAWVHKPATAAIELLLGARHLGGSRKEVLLRAHEAARRGSVAGEVLIIISQLTEHGQHGSVNKACHVLAEAGAAGKATSGGILIPFENRTSLRNNAWIPYRCVAHYWAAHNLMWNLCWHQAPGSAQPHVTWYEEASDFEKFLIMVEAFRRWGEGHIPHARHKAQVPTLVPKETWRIPPGIALPEEHLTPPPLSSWYAQYIRTYHV